MYSRVQAIVSKSRQWKAHTGVKLVWEGRADELTPEQLVGAVTVKACASQLAHALEVWQQRC